MTANPRPSPPDIGAESRYREVVHLFGAQIGRFAIGYERDSARRQELLQEIHLALWQSFSNFKGQCSLRTWTYRIAHNVGVTHVQNSLKSVKRVDLDDEELASLVDDKAAIELTDRRLDMQRLLELIHRLAPLDREVMLLYLEDMDAASIGEIAGISARNVATKVHRIKALLAKQLDSKGKPA